MGVNLSHRFRFDHSYVLDATGSDNYGAKPYVPVYIEVNWCQDGNRISLPQDFYSSRNIVDKVFRYVDGADFAKPFFGYLAFQAIHIPVQVPREYIDKYNGVFDRGWNVMWYKAPGERGHHFQIQVFVGVSHGFSSFG